MSGLRNRLEELTKDLVTGDYLKKKLEGYEDKKTRFKIKESKTPEIPKCNKCGGELKQTTQYWFKCQRCGRGYFIKF